MMRRITSFCLCVFAANVFAVDGATEVEHRYLIQVIRDIDHLKSIVEKAQSASDDAARFRLDYSTLQSDLSAMREALSRYVTAPERSPRKIEPLDKQYE